MHRLSQQWLAPVGPEKCFFLSFSLGKGPATKLDEFLEKFQTAFAPPSFLENYIATFSYLIWYGCIYARMHRPDSIS